MSTTATYVVTCPNGLVETRNSARAYTHAVLCEVTEEQRHAEARDDIALAERYLADGCRTAEQAAAMIAKGEADLALAGSGYGVWQWSGSAVNAEKGARSFRSRVSGSGYTFRVVPVEVAA